MKIKELVLKNYKRFVEETKINFCDPDTGEPMDMILLVGNNGSGKSSILQAISAVVGSVVRPNLKPSKLEWPGFDYWVMSEMKEANPEIAVHLQMSEGEISATREYAEALRQTKGFKIPVQPGDKTDVILTLDYLGDHLQAGSSAELYQLKGYQYALQMRKNKMGGMELFDRIGTILWYDEQRTSFSLATKLPWSGDKGNGDLSISKLRFDLRESYYFHRDKEELGWVLQPGQRDYYELLEKKFSKLFPGKSFHGVIPRMSPDEKGRPADFFLKSNGSLYELAELSAGERAVFPILVDFANWNINNSIIIIDELELHLHPPLQQALVRTLPKLGKNNQFIITTHSDDVAFMFSEAQIIRL